MLVEWTHEPIMESEKFYVRSSVTSPLLYLSLCPCEKDWLSHFQKENTCNVSMQQAYIQWLFHGGHSAGLGDTARL